MTVDPSQRGPGLSARDELLEASRAWAAHERQRRLVSDRRIRATWAAVDAGMSHREVAKVMSDGEGRTIHNSYVSHVLACGYPEEEATGAHGPEGDEAA